MKNYGATKPKVVVVDDEKDFLRIIESWLQERYSVTCLPGGEGLAEEIRGLEPDLVLLDAHMPAQSGFDVCGRLRSSPDGAYLPIVFLTGSNADEDFLRHLDAGGSRYLTKPINRRELLAAVAEELGQAV
ncbi:MAG: response regulator [Elusimicrobia bacterium]|nr:response regulator [Elusimicrobiota bacterium]